MDPEVQSRIHKGYLFWAESIQFLALISVSLRSIQISFSHLPQDLPIGLFNVGAHVKISKTLLPSSILFTWPTALNILDLIILTLLGERYKLWSS